MKTANLDKSTLFGALPYIPSLATSAQLRFLQGLLSQCYKRHNHEIPQDEWRKVESVQYEFNREMEGRIQMSKISASSYINMLKEVLGKANAP